MNVGMSFNVCDSCLDAVPHNMTIRSTLAKASRCRSA